jgi:hypothetical protein
VCPKSSKYFGILNDVQRFIDGRYNCVIMGFLKFLLFLTYNLLDLELEYTLRFRFIYWSQKLDWNSNNGLFDWISLLTDGFSTRFDQLITSVVLECRTWSWIFLCLLNDTQVRIEMWSRVPNVFDNMLGWLRFYLPPIIMMVTSKDHLGLYRCLTRQGLDILHVFHYLRCGEWSRVAH